MVRSVLTGVNVSTLKAGVLAIGSVGKVVESKESLKTGSCTGIKQLFYLMILGSRTAERERCPDRCGCTLGIEGWSPSDKKCKEGE